MRYRNKFMEIEAFRYMIDKSMPDWFADAVMSGKIKLGPQGETVIYNKDGKLTTKFGEYIIYIEGDETIYACEAEEFENKFEIDF